jgi:hypothetical protein
MISIEDGKVGSSAIKQKEIKLTSVGHSNSFQAIADDRIRWIARQLIVYFPKFPPMPQIAKPDGEQKHAQNTEQKHHNFSRQPPDLN